MMSRSLSIFTGLFSSPVVVILLSAELTHLHPVLKSATDNHGMPPPQYSFMFVFGVPPLIISATLDIGIYLGVIFLTPPSHAVHPAPRQAGFHLLPRSAPLWITGQSNKLNLKGFAALMDEHHGPYIAFHQTLKRSVFQRNDGVQPANHFALSVKPHSEALPLLRGVVPLLRPTP